MMLATVARMLTRAARDVGSRRTSAYTSNPRIATSRRQAERRQDMIDVLRTKGYSRVVDLSAEEQSGRFFEGTGVLVLDRINGVAYVSLSERADKVQLPLMPVHLQMRQQAHELHSCVSLSLAGMQPRAAHLIRLPEPLETAFDSDAPFPPAPMQRRMQGAGHRCPPSLNG